jgi:uncharacterized protein YndB with AHSA1/START domain
MEINDQAPVRARREVEIGATADVVWDVLTDVDAWPRWNAEVKSATVAGAVAPGAEFRWKAGPGTIQSRIERTERPRLLAWTGRTFGMSAIHVWRLEPGDGGTRVTTEESMEGLPARVLRGMVQKNLDRSLDAWLRGLKAESERLRSSPE